MSRAWNKREDEFGGSIENRAKPTVMIIEEIKRRNGKDWPLILLMNGMEPDLKDGLTLEETTQFAKIYEAAGADAIEVRSEFYTHVNDWKRRSSTHFPDCYFYPDRPANLDPDLVDDWGRGANIKIAAAFKKAVNVPVIVCGKMDWNNGEEAIKNGQADIISMNRRLLADPGVPNKVLQGRLDDITPCNSCMTCFNLGEHFKPVACRVNPNLGKEKEYEIKPAKTKKKVLIIGGGPSGMEAARTAALRGHSVVLYDKQKKLGGSMPVAAVIKGMEREDIIGFTKYLRNQMVKTGVTVYTGTEVTQAVIDREKPDVIILAAGGSHEIPAITGMNNRKVQTGEKLHTKMKFFLKYFSPEFMNKMSKMILPGMGKNIVIMGDRLHGCQTAEFLVHRGRKVTIVDSGSEDLVGDGLIDVFLKPYLIWWLEDNGVDIIPEVKYNEVTGEGLVITKKDGTRQTLKADTIITALPLKPNTELANKFKDKAKEFYNIGDSQEPALIFDAVAAGARIGHEI
jgi:2,4-dienoyl-CoA reductase (NADPH2)